MPDIKRTLENLLYCWDPLNLTFYNNREQLEDDKKARSRALQEAHGLESKNKNFRSRLYHGQESKLAASVAREEC